MGLLTMCVLGCAFLTFDSALPDSQGPEVATTDNSTRGILQNMFITLADNFQELVNRQQALLDMIYCKNCGANAWQNFLNAMAHIPTLGWVMRPPHTQGQKPDGSFIAATNVKGVVNGVGGNIYNGDPMVEYTFNNNHVAPVRPQKPDALSSVFKQAWEL